MLERRGIGNLTSGRLGLRSIFAILAVLVLVTLSSNSQAEEALPQPDTEPGAFYWRVLSLPKAVLHNEPNEQSQAIVAEVPAFTVYYVYDKKEEGDASWVRVGKMPVDGAEGWIRTEQTEDWRSMLVMQYAPRGRRSRALFFKEKEALVDIVEGHYPEQARELLQNAESGNPDSTKLAALEPEAAILVTDKPYLMPIFDFEYVNFGDELATETALLQVGGLNLKQGEESAPSTGEQSVPSMQSFKIAVTFVIDTTASMGPYIEATRTAIREIYKKLEQDGTVKKVTFGLVGYRDDTDYDPLIEYVTKIYQPLDLTAAPDLVLENIKKVQPSTVSTRGWNEDAYAGILSAIDGLDWEPFDSRVIILVSDAGARAFDDPHAAHSNISSEFVRERARQKNIAILPLHMQTPQAKQSGNVESTAQQYTKLGESGDRNESKYIGVKAGDVATFVQKLAHMSQRLAESIKSIENPPSQEDEEGEQEPQADNNDLANFLVNEIFRSQLEYIGAQNNEQSPHFFRAWVSDRDLNRSRFQALDASVFLTRNQLNGLAKSLDDVLARARAAELEASGLFDLLRSLAATTSVDPTRSGQAGEFENIAESGLLPTFLNALPYYSKLLSLTAEEWQGWSSPRRAEELTMLSQKLQIYRIINEDTDNWLDLGAGDPGLEVYPILLSHLP